VAVVLGDARLELSDRPWLAAYDGRTVVLGIRPEDMEDAAIAGDDGSPRLRGRVELREALGADVLVHFTVAARAAVTEDVRELAADVGDDRVLSQDAADAALVGRFSPRTRVVEGDSVEVSVDRSALHFFDSQTGLAIRGS
jgi:multiple sugar transport system ATP-binding protein